MEKYADPIILQILGIVVAGACGWLASQVARLSKRDSALYEGMKVILRSSLADAYEMYVTEQRPLTLERKREIDEAWEAYAALGGNGTGRQMYAELCERPIKRI